MAHGKTSKSFPHWKRVEDIEGDQAMEVKVLKSRKGLEFLYHKGKEKEEEEEEEEEEEM